jgi:hypothetical protein
VTVTRRIVSGSRVRDGCVGSASRRWPELSRCVHRACLLQSVPGVAFNDQLRAYGLCLRTIGSDGNCLFRSIADQLTGKQDLHMEYREKIVAYMLRHPLDFAPFVWDETFESYCNKMKKNSTWGGAAELAAASKCFGINITVHQYNAARLENIYDPLSVTPDPNCDDVPIPVTRDTKTIHLSYHDAEHYSSVRNITDAHSFEAATPIAIPTGPITTSAASSSSSSSSAAVSSLTHQEVIVTQSIACVNIPKIRKLLKESWNDPNVVIEILYAEQTMGLDINVDHDHAAEQQRQIQMQRQVEEEKAARDRAEEEQRRQQLQHQQRLQAEEKREHAAADDSCLEEEHKSDDPDESKDDDHVSDDERDAIAAVEAFESFDTPAASSSSSSSFSNSAAPAPATASSFSSVSVAPPTASSSAAPKKSVVPPKRLTGRDKKIAKNHAKMIAEKQKRLNKGAVKKERAQAEQVEQQVVNNLGAVRI